MSLGDRPTSHLKGEDLAKKFKTTHFITIVDSLDSFSSFHHPSRHAKKFKTTPL
jgi:hypothetical protein